MKKFLHRSLARLLLAALVLSLLTVPAFADASSYTSTTLDGHTANFVTVDMTADVRPGVMIANNSITAAQSVADMAQANGAFAAINGTYFSAYDGHPVPYGTLIRGGKLLHVGGGAVAGFTADGRLVIDRLKFAFSGYVNDVLQFYPWRMNELGVESGAISLFTAEYRETVTPPEGAMTVLTDSSGRVTSITSGPFNVPEDGLAIMFNMDVAYLVPERFHLGDIVTYEAEITTTFTQLSDWETVTEAVGAGPSLIINGVVTADGAAEGFTEAKINVNRAGRSFIGATADGQVLIGNIGSATLMEAAAVCQKLGLINAMCLDGGGSIALYHNGSKTAGRDVNNALGFFYGALAEAVPSQIFQHRPDPVSAFGHHQALMLDGEAVVLYAYSIEGNNYFKLRDLASLLDGTEAQFSVGYDNATHAVTLGSGQSYAPVGGEGELKAEEALMVRPTEAKLFVDGVEQEITAYNINGSNYFKLRDLGQMLDFGVGYEAERKMVLVDPHTGYTE